MEAAHTDAEECDAHAFRDELQLLITTLQEAWAYAEWNQERIGLDLGALAEKYGKELERAATIPAGIDALRRLVAELCDGHAGLSVPKARDEANLAALPAQLYLYGREVYFERPWFPEQWAPAPNRGDRIVAINGLQVEEVLADAAARTPASTSRRLRS